MERRLQDLIQRLHAHRAEEAQLKRLAAIGARMAQKARELFIIQNNHFRGKALVNALQMKRILEQRPPAAPEELVLAYPELEPQVRVRRTRLF